MWSIELIASSLNVQSQNKNQVLQGEKHFLHNYCLENEP